MSFTNIFDFAMTMWQRVLPSSAKARGELSLETAQASMQTQYFNTGGGISYYESRFVAKEDVKIDFSSPERFSFLFFNTGAPAIMKDAASGLEQTASTGAMISGTMQKDFRGTKIYKKGKLYSVQCFSFSQDLARELFKTNAVAPEFTLGKPSFSQQLSLDDLHGASNFKGALQDIFMEAKILEVVYKSFASDYETPPLSKKDAQSLQKAREILLANLQDPPSIRELSKLVGLNDFKLKRGFKELFKKTIHRTLQEARMDLARELLSKNDINVSQAADLVGYRSLGHFSKTFKDYYDCLPTDFLKNKKIYV
ncbi:MAG: helix-turn-helix domain-containing protein [Helicobacteraceae bacterium]